MRSTDRTNNLDFIRGTPSEAFNDLGDETIQLAVVNHRLEQCLTATPSNRLRDELHKVLADIPTLYELVSQNARGDRDITLLDHSVDTILQSLRYNVDRLLPVDGLTPLAFKKFLLFHDSGKSLPPKKEDAGKFTIEVIERHNEYLAFSARELAIVRALLAYDPIGRVMHCGVCPFDKNTEAKFAALRNPVSGDIPLEKRELIDPRYILKSKHAKGELRLLDLIDYSESARVTDSSIALRAALVKSAEEIKESAAEARMPLQSYFQLLTIFYQLDISSYTVDVGLKPEVGLEFLLRINPTFSIENLDAEKLFLPNTQLQVPFQFSPAAARVHGLLAQFLTE